MSYPTLIAPLHFQYKTAFDILKTYFPIKNDDELSTMVLDFKSNKDSHVKQKKVPAKVPKKKNDSTLDSTQTDSTQTDSTQTDSTQTDSTQTDSTQNNVNDYTQNNDSISKIKKKSKKI
jgi:hypothetical protein